MTGRWSFVMFLLVICKCHADELPTSVSATYGRNYNDLNQAQFPVSAENGFDHLQDVLSVNVNGDNAGVTWRVRLLLSRDDDANTLSKKVTVKEINKIWRMSENCFVSAGKRILSWDVGYLAQPLGFFQSQPVLSDLDDKYGNSEGLPLVMLSCSLANGAAIDMVRSDDIQHRTDSDNTNLHQTALRYSQHIGLSSYSVVLRKVGGDGEGVGFTYSTTIGESVELHMSDYTSKGARQQLHDGIVSGTDRFWSDTPYIEMSNNKLASHLLVGAIWTPDPYSSISAEISHNDAGLTKNQWNRWVDLVQFHQSSAGSGLPGSVRAANLLWDLSTIKQDGTRQNYLYVQALRSESDFSYSVGHEFGLDDGSGVTVFSASRRLNRSLTLGVSFNYYSGKGRDEFAFLPYRWSGATFISAAF